MRRYEKRYWLLAACLSTLAGYVDAVGFLQLGGLFVSFMSGNSTRLAVGLAQGAAVARLAAGLIAFFVLGVFVGALVATISGATRKATVLALVSLLLCLAALLASAPGAYWPPFALACAMGAANCVFMRDGEVSIGVTYMTGTLVKLGQHLASAALGRDRRGWAPYLLLWGGLVAGAVCGAAIYPRLGANSLWMPAAVAAGLAVYAYRLGPAPLAQWGPGGVARGETSLPPP